MGSKCKCSHNAGLQVAIGTVKDTGTKPALQFEFNILLSANFCCSAGHICYHRNNSCFHSAKFSVITGYLLCSFLAIPISKMLDWFLKTNWQAATKYWSANCMYFFKCPGLKTSIIKFLSSQHKILIGTWKSTSDKGAFPLKSVGMLLSTSKGWEGCPQQAHPFYSLIDANLLTWKWNMWVRTKRAHVCAAQDQPRSVIFGQLHKRQEGGALLSPSVGSAGLQPTIRRGFQRGGTGLPEGLSASYSRLLKGKRK